MKKHVISALSAGFALMLLNNGSSAERLRDRSGVAVQASQKNNPQLGIKASPSRPQGQYCWNISPSNPNLVAWGGEDWTCVDNGSGVNACVDDDGNSWSEPNPC